MEKYLQYQLKAIILCNFQKEGRLAQLVRAFALHAKCRRFESVIAHHPSLKLRMAGRKACYP